jgi:signal transduction histidine kinase
MWYRGRLWAKIALAFAVGLAAFALAAVLCTAARGHVPVVLVGGLLLLVVLAVARFAGILFALPAGVVTILAYDWFILPPLRDFDGATVFLLGLFLTMSVIVAAVTDEATRRAVASERARAVLAEEQAGLRRVATLVAKGATPEEVFTAVTSEVGRVLDADVVVMDGYDADGTQEVLSVWTDGAIPVPVPVGTRVPLGGRNVSTIVFETGRPARLDGYDDATGEVGEIARATGIRSSVGAPISVDGRLWGLVIVASSRSEPLPADLESRLERFTELVATAIANTEARLALSASRARIVAAADAARRRIQRDLHDGAQQRLVSLALQVRTVQAEAQAPVSQHLDVVVDGLADALEELREIAHGIHPAVLTERGLHPALRGLARRCPVPVQADIQVDRRLPDPVEIAAYYVVAEALTNAAKHADASLVTVDVAIDPGGGSPLDHEGPPSAALRIAVRDDGRGGAEFEPGSGLVGVQDRVEALGGRVVLRSPAGAGTTLDITIPVGAPEPAGTGA